MTDDLFREEDPAAAPKAGPGPLPGPPPPDFGPSPGAQRGRRGMFVVGGIVLLVLAVVLWYASSKHHEKFYVVVDGDTVRVERGWFFPVGASEWAPTRAYAPFKLPLGVVPSRTGSMTEEESDTVLMKLFLDIARRELNNLKEGEPNVAEDMLMRAGKLRFTSVTDDRLILEMLGDVAFRRGLTEVSGVQTRFDEALRQFQLAAMRGGAVYKGAGRWVEAIRRLRDEFRALSVESGLDPDQILVTPPSAPPSAVPPPVDHDAPTAPASKADAGE